MSYKFVEHTADIKFIARAKNIEELFVECSKALFESIKENKKIENKLSKNIKITGKTNEDLLYNFLEEFLFLLDSQNFIANKIDNIKIENHKLNAKISGDFVNNYNLSNSVKAITFNEMKIKKTDKNWSATCVLDV